MPGTTQCAPVRNPFSARNSTLQAGRERLRIAVVVPIFTLAEGVGSAVGDTVRAVSTVPHWSASVFTVGSEIKEPFVHLVENVGALAAHPEFKSADIIIYHYGFYGELFDIVPEGNGRARQILFFHNITPPEFLSAQWRPLGERSFQQLQNFRGVDRLWPFTKSNAEVLLRAGMDPARMEIVEPVVEWPLPGSLAEKAKLPVEILFVGRIVPAKGVLDLLEAVDRLRSRTSVPFHLSIVGKSLDQAYADKVGARVAQLAPLVEFVGRAEADELARRYRRAHILAIPSYHEGFCRPVIEGLRAGCIPVGYSSVQIPVTANGLGCLSAAGNIDLLAASLQSVVESLAGAAVDRNASLPLDRGPTTIAEFDMLASDYGRHFSFERLVASVTNGIRRLSR